MTPLHPSLPLIQGQIDPEKYSLNPCDTGGQYDIKAPVGATCAGYSHFVNVIEPEIGIYGMRCCQNTNDCDVRHSTYGARVILGEQYDFSGPRADGVLPRSTQCVDGSLPSNVTTTSPTVSATTTTFNLPTTTATTTSSSAQKTETPSANGSNTGTTDTKTSNAAPSNSIMMAATAVFAAAIGLMMA